MALILLPVAEVLPSQLSDSTLKVKTVQRLATPCRPPALSSRRLLLVGGQESRCRAIHPTLHGGSDVGLLSEKAKHQIAKPGVRKSYRVSMPKLP